MMPSSQCSNISAWVTMNKLYDIHDQFHFFPPLRTRCIFITDTLYLKPLRSSGFSCLFSDGYLILGNFFWSVCFIFLEDSFLGQPFSQPSSVRS